MAKTLQDIIDDARVYIQDVDTPYRNDDAEMLSYLNSGIYEIYRIRPDYFTAYFDAGIPQFDESQLSEDYPIDQQTAIALTYFIAGNEEAKNDEDVLEGRASGFINLFKASLMGAA